LVRVDPERVASGRQTLRTLAGTGHALVSSCI
jgi:hypothetical protein